MKITEGHMVVFKAVCYFAIAFLTPLSGLLATAADANTQAWPTDLQIVSCLLSGAIAGLVSLRAYFDGSNARYEAARNGDFHAQPEPKPGAIAPTTGETNETILRPRAVPPAALTTH